MTYSILGFDPKTGGIGAAIQSKFPGVATLCLHGAPGAGLIVTQAFSNPDHGPRGLALLDLGVDPATVIAVLTRQDQAVDERQIAVMSTAGAVSAFTGAGLSDWVGSAGSAAGRGCLALGNSLRGRAVLQAMVARFEDGADRNEALAPRLIAALAAGEEVGGELRGVQAAGVLTLRPGGGYQGRGGREVDISVYDHPDPIGELSRCYALHRLSYLPNDEAAVIPITADLAQELSGILIAEGFMDGAPRDAWGPDEITAMIRFMGHENYDSRIRDDARIDTEVLADIRARRGVSGG